MQVIAAATSVEAEGQVDRARQHRRQQVRPGRQAHRPSEEVHRGRLVVDADAVAQDRDQGALLHQRLHLQHGVDSVHVEDPGGELGVERAEEGRQLLGVLEVGEDVDVVALEVARGPHRLEAPEVRPQQDRAAARLRERAEVVVAVPPEAQAAQLAGQQEDAVEGDESEGSEVPVRVPPADRAVPHVRQPRPRGLTRGSVRQRVVDHEDGHEGPRGRPTEGARQPEHERHAPRRAALLLRHPGVGGLLAHRRCSSRGRPPRSTQPTSRPSPSTHSLVWSQEICAVSARVR